MLRRTSAQCRCLAVGIHISLGLLGCQPAQAPSRESARSTPQASTEIGSEPLELSAPDARDLLCEIYRRVDTDRDARITIEDQRRGQIEWPLQVSLPGRGQLAEIRDLQTTSRVVQEIAAQLDASPTENETVRLLPERVSASTADYLLLQITERFWPNLTRSIQPDPSLLAQVMSDQKVQDGETAAFDWCNGNTTPPQQHSQNRVTEQWLYVAERDEQALLTYQALAKSGQADWLEVERVPTFPPFGWLDRVTDERHHGLLMLAHEGGRGKPFVVPGGRFNEMYGWDSFFIERGLLATPGNEELARSLVDHFSYQIRHYGKILNANRTYYLTRSQPPFFTRMIEQAFAASSSEFRESAAGKQWLEHSYQAALLEYERVWLQPPHRTVYCKAEPGTEEACLTRYHGDGKGQPPEVEPGHFAWVYQARADCAIDEDNPQEYLKCTQQYGELYRRRESGSPFLDGFFAHDRCMRESGHDTTYRWFDDELGMERCKDFASVELQALLLRYELDFATHALRSGKSPDRFCKNARHRAWLIKDLLWSEEDTLFLDFDMRRMKRHDFLAATTLFPLWAVSDATCSVQLLSAAEASATIKAALAELEMAGGLAATSQKAVQSVQPATILRLRNGKLQREPIQRQWDYPNGWAPHQMIAWQALRNWGHELDAQRLAYKWLYTIARNATDYHGTVPEKFDVVRRSHQVFQEYGNVNTDFAYIAHEGFGWMNASFVVGFSLLSPEQQDALRRLVPPEELQHLLGTPR